MTTFASFGLPEKILSSLDELGFKEPTPIQSKAIPQIIGSKRDVVAFAATGTGKTAAFSLPILAGLSEAETFVQTLIIAPTRELALQIKSDIDKFAGHLTWFRSVAVYGGDSVRRQIGELRRKPQVVVGTPGRLSDMIRQKQLVVKNIKFLVLDEADEMLDMGFKEDLDFILETTPSHRQTLLFSATMPPELNRIAAEYLSDPIEISAGEKNVSTTSVEHVYYMVHAKDRYEALRRIADTHPDIYAMVFCETKQETKEVANKLSRDHYPAEAIHGDVAQSDREAVMNRFRDRKTKMLIATDVAARGIDVKELTHVINFSLPRTVESYIHRSGRTGRGGRTGISIAIINTREMGRIRQIERSIKKSFRQEEMLDGESICLIQLKNLIEEVKKNKDDHPKLAPYLPEIFKAFEDMSKEEIIKRVVGTEFGRFLTRYENAAPLSVENRSARDGFRPRPEHSSGLITGQTETIIFPVGRHDRISVKDVLNFINRERELRGIKIGNISIGDRETAIEVEQELAEKVRFVLGGKVPKAFAGQGRFDRPNTGFSPRPGRGTQGNRRKDDRTFTKRGRW